MSSHRRLFNNFRARVDGSASAQQSRAEDRQDSPASGQQVGIYAGLPEAQAAGSSAELPTSDDLTLKDTSLLKPLSSGLDSSTSTGSEEDIEDFPTPFQSSTDQFGLAQQALIQFIRSYRPTPAKSDPAGTMDNQTMGQDSGDGMPSASSLSDTSVILSEEDHMLDMVYVRPHKHQFNELLRRVTEFKKGIQMTDAAGNISYHACNWEAGNPSDGAVAPLINQIQDMGKEDLLMLAKNLIDSNPWMQLHDFPYTRWNKTSHMGTILSQGNEKSIYVEFQYKRISGADYTLGYACSYEPGRVLAKLKDIPIVTEDDDNDCNNDDAMTGIKQEPSTTNEETVDTKGKGVDRSSPTPAGPTRVLSLNLKDDPEAEKAPASDEAAAAAAAKAAAAEGERIKKSWVYIVRAIAIPAPPGSYFNAFTGPPIPDRRYTLLGEGGWVVPPLEEREALRKKRADEYAPLKKPGYKRTRLHSDVAAPAIPDRSDWLPGPISFGSDPEVWLEVADPCKEDVYWLIWNLLAGKQYRGFRCGVGFGLNRDDPGTDEFRRLVAEKNPFTSPSMAARTHSANC